MERRGGGRRDRRRSRSRSRGRRRRRRGLLGVCEENSERGFVTKLICKCVLSVHQ